MVDITRVAYVTLNGNTFSNIERLNRVGAKFDNGGKYWMLKIDGHPLNNVKQKKKLLAMLNELEENGVRFTYWTMDGRQR